MPLRLRVALYVLLIGGILAYTTWKVVEHRAESRAEAHHGLDEFLEPWYEALENQADEPATVVMVGDSITEGALLPTPVHRNRVVGLLQDALREDQGVSGGTGYMPAYYGDQITLDDTVRGGTPAREEMFGVWGLGGRALMMPGGSIVQYPAQEATSVRVWFGETSMLGGQGKVFIDGEDVTDDGRMSDGRYSRPTISSTGPSSRSGLWWQSPPLGEGKHEVEVHSAAPGYVFVHTGVEFFDGDEDSGIHVYDASHSGVTASHFASENAEKGHWNEVAKIDPDVILVNLGTNAEPDYATSMERVVELAAEAAPRARIVLVDGYEPGNTTPERWQEIRDVRAALAEEHPDRVAVYDLASRWPELAKDGSTNGGLMAKEAFPVHPNQEGHARMAELYAQVLTRGDD